jgi:hypothetical protein
MVAGVAPFSDETPQQYLISHAKRSPKRLHEVNPTLAGESPQLEAVIFKALEKNRENRFSSAKEFAQALEAALPTLSDIPLSTDKTLVVPAPSSASRPLPIPTLPSTSPRTISQEKTVITTPGSPSTTIRNDKTYVVPPPAPAPPPIVAPQTQVTQNKRRGAPILLFVLIGVILFVGLAIVAAIAIPTILRKRETIASNSATQTTTSAVTDASGSAATSSLTVSAPPIATETTATASAITTMPLATDTTATTATVTSTQPVVPTATSSQAPPVNRKLPPPPKQQPPKTETVVTIETETAPPPQQNVELPKSEQHGGLFHRGGKSLADSKEYKSGFTRGIIPDYAAMVAGDNVQWMYIAPGTKLADYKIRIGHFRNLTSTPASAAVTGFLEGDMQSQIDDVASGSRGTLTTDNAIYWAESSSSKKRGIGIEMIFRDSSGRIVAMLRHRIFENSPEDAAEEMPGAIADFVDSNG